ncbi:MAG TPA: protein kinase [Sandaracinaceae bacterium LLY-WYZ-13_1]|nr:protein kinase [Sandaracinaceae bacterium LLY-WYZ-13_1]
MAAAHDSPPPEAPPSYVGPYRVEGVLGRGGMGVVYRGRGPDGAVVAVKVLRPGSRRAGELRRRFEQEGRVRIEHPNVVRTLGSGDDGDTLWIAFELLEGRSLADRLEAGERLEIAEALDIGRQAAAGLAAAHADGIVHRDLKPSNLFLCDDGAVKVVDFGIARVTDRDTRLTATGHLVGTAAYLSPEQARGDAEVGAASDVWSLDVVLYEAIAGRHPFDRGSLMATMLAILAEQAAPLSTLRAEVPRGLAGVIARCLERAAERRFRDGAALLDALESVRADDAIDTTATDATALSLPLTGTAIAPGERRVVAVMLADGVRDRGAVAAAVEGAGGVVVPLGERALGLFGSARWEGDEMDRAARAAFAARPAARAVSVASGRASYSGTTGITGSVLEAAEAGCRAAVDGVALDESTTRALARRWKVRTHETGGELISERPLPRDDTSTGRSLAPPAHGLTVGREAELAQLRRAVRTLEEEGMAVALLAVGTPGAGKSHLLWEMARILEREALEPPRVLTARVEPLHRDASFALFRELLLSRAWLGHEREGWPSPDAAASPEERRGAAEALAREAHVEADFVAELLGAPADETDELSAARRDPRLMADRLRLTLGDWLEALVDAGPLALLLDDLQWADEASLDLIEELVGQLSDAPLLVMAGARPELTEARPELLASVMAARIEPRPLLPSEVEELASRLVGRPLPAGLGRRLAERTGGNPLFVEQIVRALDADARLDGPADELPLPVTVEAAVQSRLDHLPGAEKELCKRAAVVERPVGPAELEALGVMEPKPLLASLVRREVLAARGRARGLRRYRFRSPLVREVAYGMLGPGLLEELHGRLATHLEAQDDADPEEVATHLERAGRRDAAAGWYERAARAAARRGDPTGALRCAERALALGVTDDAVCGLHLLRSDALEVLGRLEPQSEALADAAASASTDAERARAGIDRAVSRWRLGAPDEAVALARDAIEAARRAGDPETLALTLGRFAVLRTYTGALDEAAAALAEAEPVASELGGLLAAHAASWRAQLANARGDQAERRRAYREAVAGYERAGDVRRGCGAELNLADAANRVGAYAEAERALEEAARKAERVGNPLWEGYARVNQAYARLALGRADRAREALDEAARLAGATGETRLAVLTQLYGARARWVEGDAAAAAREATAAAEEAARHRLEGLRALALALAARAHLASGAVEAADAASAEALRLRDDLGALEEDEAEVFLVRARVLEATERYVEGQDVRDRGRARLRELAAQIADGELRARFLEDVPAHRDLAAGA